MMNDITSQNEAWILLNYIFYLSNAKAISVLSHFNNNPLEFFQTSSKYLLPLIGGRLLDKVNSLDKTRFIDNLYAITEKNNISITTCSDVNYPLVLKEIYDYPLVLFSKGKPLEQDLVGISIVGGRKCSEYGRGVAFKFAKELSLCGLKVISGMARGIDSKAHEGALQGKSDTIAVLGSGLNYIYPKENKKLSESIINKGILLSEYFPDTAPLAEHFPYRNRIISGLSKALVVIEAREKSGSLITASAALDQNRLIYAVPGRINDKSFAGCNQLIHDGATLITSVSDLLMDLGIEHKVQDLIEHRVTTLSEMEQRFLEVLRDQPVHLDLLKEMFPDINNSTLSFHLLQLELKKFIKRLAGNYFIRAYEERAK